MVRIIITFAVLLISCPVRAEIFKVQDFGAVPNDHQPDTEAFQQAIDHCSKEGGTVLVPAGVFDIGSLELKSHVHIRLDNGSVLSGTIKREDYPIHKAKFPSYTNRYQLSALLFAENAIDILIDGNGTINGNGAEGDFYMSKEEWKTAENDRQRPFLILMRRCRNITIDGITMKNSAFWMQQYLECENLRLTNLDINNHANYNNDGIDINNCKDVIIDKCRIYCSDDAIAIKSTTEKINENILVSNCILRSHYNGFKIGTETNGGVKNLTLTNCIIGSPGYENHHGSNNMGYCGIALQSNDGAVIENITINNVVIDSMMASFFIRLQDRGRTISDTHVRQPPGKMRNINISNVIATNVTKLASSVTGIPGHYVENVHFSNIQIYPKGGGSEEDLQGTVPECEDSYPDVIMFKSNLPAFGFYVRHVKNILFNNVSIFPEKIDARYGFYFEDVQNERINDLNFPDWCDNRKYLFIKNE